jgi:L-threonylcarbamoyladenylate synthase
VAVLFHRLDDDRLIAMLKQGAVGVLPTDTVYGLVCLAANQSSVERLFGDIKPREHKPGTVVGATLEQFVQLGVKKRYLTAVEQFWPGPVSVEVPHGVAYLHRGTGRQAFRVPVQQRLLRGRCIHEI